MSEARTAILSAIRIGHAGRGKTTGRPDPLPAHPRPQFEQDPVVRFLARLGASGATIEQVSRVAETGAALLRYLDAQQMPRVVVTDDVISDAGFAWPAELDLQQRPARDGDRVSLTGAFAAVAETGSLVLRSGARRPTTLNFLPEHHIVLLHRAAVVPHFEDAWTKLRATGEALPRTVNIITGPSRTADVEQTIAMGAHGPRCLHVIFVS
ncbi:MAG: lactate utilization protein [Pseudomonadota bacterium]|nr:MAG: lactate utilization protein [Pseudomonadota bacterium]